MIPKANRRSLIALALGATVALLFAASEPGLRLERLLLDRHAALFESGKPSESIALVTLDDATFDILADEMDGLKWPYPRALHAQAIRALLDAGARAVAVDIIFDLPSGFGADDDRALAEVMRSGKVYLSAEASEQTVTPILSSLADAGAHAANAAVPVDIDGVVRWTLGARTLPRGFLEALTCFAGWCPSPRVPPFAGFAEKIATAELGVRELPRGLLAFPRGTSRFETISYFQVLEPELFRTQRDKIRGKVVFIGRAPSASITPEQQADTHLTPAGFLPGVAIHANHLEHLLAGRIYRLLPELSSPLVVFGWFALLALALLSLHSLPALGAVALAATAAYEAAAIGALSFGWILPVLLPLLLPVSLALALLGVRYLEERDARLITRAQLFHYLPPRVAEHVLRDPSRQAVAADRKQITLLFGDVAGFTSLSEREPPELVLSLLQTHLRDLAEVIFAHEGTLDKYIGDGIMAFWNAPEEQELHASLAVEAGLEMLSRVAEQNASREALGQPKLVLRLGIHLGEAIVGNIGSELFFDYTAIGDSVNTASRLEGANKAFGTRLLVSETVYAELPEKLRRELVFVGRIALQGKSSPLAVYARGERERSEADDRLEAALSLLDERNASAAGEVFDALLAEEPGYGPAAFHAAQLRKHGMPQYHSNIAYWPLSEK